MSITTAVSSGVVALSSMASGAKLTLDVPSPAGPVFGSPSVYAEKMRQREKSWWAVRGPLEILMKAWGLKVVAMEPQTNRRLSLMHGSVHGKALLKSAVHPQ
jgi:hypothetical protein